MKELSLNILDIAENSVRANATLIKISVAADTADDTLEITISDNGCGMSEELLKAVCDPFTTTRTTRKVGLGVPLFKEAAEATGGNMTITSKEGEGTMTKAVFGLSHIDRAPLGDIASTIATLIQCNSYIDFVFSYTADGRNFAVDTRELRQILDGVPFSEPQVVCWLRDYIEQNTNEINGGIKA
ncbi:MAG: ATP-binding protein [Oscillospiraceae bacterium]|nr:ATP-binding protein [Oscillospiraceae bacterium]